MRAGDVDERPLVLGHIGEEIERLHRGMEGVDVKVGLRVGLRLAHLAQDRLHVGQRLLIERADIAVQPAPDGIFENRLDPGHRVQSGSGSTANRRVTVSPCSISRAGAAWAKSLSRSRSEFIARQGKSSRSTNPSRSKAARSSRRDQVRQARTAPPRHGVRELRAARMQATPVQLG